MTELIDNSLAALVGRDWTEFAIFGGLTFASLVAVECYFAKHGTMERKFYIRRFHAFHWALGAVVWVVCMVVSYDLDKQAGEGLWLTLAFVGFFGTVAALEFLHQQIWEKLAPDRESHSAPSTRSTTRR